MCIEDWTWEEVLKESFECYLKYGARSSKKLIAPHYWIREKIKENFDDSYEFYSCGYDNTRYDKEYSVKGIAYNKKSDITILKNNTVIGVVSFKFISSNYSQNSNNYFENLLGECFNIQARGIPFCHILVVRDKIPYYKKNGEYKKCEYLKNHHLNKYFNILNLDKNYMSVPMKLCINIIEIKLKNGNIKELYPKKFVNFEEKSEEDKLELDEILNNMSVNLVNDYESCSNEIKSELNEMEVIKILKDFSEIVKNHPNK